MKDKILIFNVNDENTIKKIQMALAIQNIAIKKVDLSDYQQTIGYLAGIKSSTKNSTTYEGDDFLLPMVVFCFGREKLDQVLQSFQNMKVPPIAHKAMMTPTNQSWTPIELFEELTLEIASRQ